MHQERHHPGHVIATTLRNPDFAAYAKAFGGFGATVEKTEEFADAFTAAQQSGKPAIIHVKVDSEAITPSTTLAAIRKQSAQGEPRKGHRAADAPKKSCGMEPGNASRVHELLINLLIPNLSEEGTLVSGTGSFLVRPVCIVIAAGLFHAASGSGALSSDNCRRLEDLARQYAGVQLTSEQQKLKRRLVSWYGANCKRTRSADVRH
jgi:hypothetical protein